MRKHHFYPFFIFLLIGTFLLVGCQKQENETPLADDQMTVDHKASGGYALYFDGTDDHVMVPDDPSLDLTEAFSIAAWIKMETYVEWASFVTKGGYTGANNYTIHQSGPQGNTEPGHLRFTGDSPALPIYLESNTQISLNEWHFVAITWNGETLKFYLDGEYDGGGALQGPLNPNDEPLLIGVDPPGSVEFWYGKIDEVRIWDEALKQTHIQAAMNGHASPFAHALVGYWRFDEGEGDVAKDRSKYKNHGVLEGDPTWVNPGAP